VEQGYATFAEAAHAYAGLVREIPDDAWERPGLGEWTVRDLVGHTSRSLITVETYLDRPAQSEEVSGPAEYYRLAGAVDPASVAERGREAGRALGSEPSAFVDDLVVRVLALVADAADPVISTALGGMRLSQYLPTRTFELVVHALDISSATRLPAPAYGDAVLNEVVTLAATAAVRQGRGSEVLRALTGRGSLPTGFSVV
jgi:uncharacterized protein (TIGR03083 family)